MRCEERGLCSGAVTPVDSRWHSAQEEHYQRRHQRRLSPLRAPLVAPWHVPSPHLHQDIFTMGVGKSWLWLLDIVHLFLVFWIFMEVSALVHDTFNVLIEAFIINASYNYRLFSLLPAGQESCIEPTWTWPCPLPVSVHKIKLAF